MNTPNPQPLSGQPSGPECARYASLLPRFRQGTHSPADDTVLRAHLATCAYCAAQLAIYDRLDAALHTYVEHFAPTAPSADDLVRAAVARVSGASPAAMNHHQSSAQGVRPNDIQRDMAMFDTQSEATTLPPSPPTSGRPPHHGRQHPVLATIAAVLLIGMAVTIFNVLTRTNSGPAHKGAPAATATAHHQQPPTPLHLPVGVSLLGLSMASPTDGWAVGVTADRKTLLLRYHDGQWTIWPGALPNQLLLLSADALSADAPDDAWLTGVGGMLHYTNNQWAAVSIPGVGAISKVRMISPTDGWARGYIQTPDKQDGAFGMLRYHNGAWSIVALPATMQGLRDDSRLDFSVTPSGECWLMYQDASSGATEILRSDGGAFQVAATIPQFKGQHITMHSSQDGWLAGRDASGKVNVLYHFDGSAWTKTTIPATFTQHTLILVPVVRGSSSDSWLLGINPDTRDLVVASRYHNGAWQTVRVPSGVMMDTFDLVGNDEGWAIGTGKDRSVLYHYQNGVWTQYPN